MSATDLICKAFDKGWNAGNADRPKAECPFAPFSQQEKWQAWMIGYEEAYERYAARTPNPPSVASARQQ